jgi:hypothetical protein
MQTDIIGVGVASVDYTEYTSWNLLTAYNLAMKPLLPIFKGGTGNTYVADYGTLINQIAAFKDIAKNGVLADPNSSSQYKSFMNEAMVDSLNNVMRTLALVGIPPSVPLDDTNDPTGSQRMVLLQAWQSLPQFGINVEGYLNQALSIFTNASTYRVPALGKDGLPIEGGLVVKAFPTRSLQSALELEYVSYGNQLISTQLANLENALTTTQKIMNTLTSVQDVLNQITVSPNKPNSPFVFPPRPPEYTDIFTRIVNNTDGTRDILINGIQSNVNNSMAAKINDLYVNGTPAQKTIIQNAIDSYNLNLNNILPVLGGSPYTPIQIPLSADSQFFNSNPPGPYSRDQLPFSNPGFVSDAVNSSYYSLNTQQRNAIDRAIQLFNARHAGDPNYPILSIPLVSPPMFGQPYDIFSDGGNSPLTDVLTQIPEVATAAVNDYHNNTGNTIAGQIVLNGFNNAENPSKAFRDAYKIAASAYFMQLIPSTAIPNITTAASNLLQLKSLLLNEVVQLETINPDSGRNVAGSLANVSYLVVGDISAVFKNVNRIDTPKPVPTNDVLAAEIRVGTPNNFMNTVFGLLNGTPTDPNTIAVKNYFTSHGLSTNFPAPLSNAQMTVQDTINLINLIPAIKTAALSDYNSPAYFQYHLQLQLLSSVKTFIMDGQGKTIAQLQSVATQNPIQTHVTNALTAAITAEESSREDVKRYIFIFQQFYKTTAAMLTALEKMLENIAKGVSE